MAEGTTMDARITKLEIGAARTHEQYSQILKSLAEITGQLNAQQTIYVRRDLCEQAHKAYDREQYEFRHGIEKRIIESDAILAGEMMKLEKRLDNNINGIGIKLTGWTNRLWWILGLALSPALAILAKEVFNNVK